MICICEDVIDRVIQIKRFGEQTWKGVFARAVLCVRLCVCVCESLCRSSIGKNNIYEIVRGNVVVI